MIKYETMYAKTRGLNKLIYDRVKFGLSNLDEVNMVFVEFKKALLYFSIQFDKALKAKNYEECQYLSSQYRKNIFLLDYVIGENHNIFF